MVNPKYSHIGSPLIKTIEECSELIKNLCKADRFGWFAHHPEDPEQTPNIKLVANEMDDVIAAITELSKYIEEVAVLEFIGNPKIKKE